MVFETGKCYEVKEEIAGCSVGDILKLRRDNARYVFYKGKNSVLCVDDDDTKDPIYDKCLEMIDESYDKFNEKRKETIMENETEMKIDDNQEDIWLGSYEDLINDLDDDMLLDENNIKLAEAYLSDEEEEEDLDLDNDDFEEQELDFEERPGIREYDLEEVDEVEESKKPEKKHLVESRRKQITEVHSNDSELIDTVNYCVKTLLSHSGRPILQDIFESHWTVSDGLIYAIAGLLYFGQHDEAKRIANRLEKEIDKFEE